MTTYVILAQDEDDGGWHEQGRVEAAGSDTAIRKAAETTEEGLHLFVAIPARSWQPTTVTRETKPVTTLSRPETQRRPKPAEPKTEAPAA